MSVIIHVHWISLSLIGQFAHLHSSFTYFLIGIHSTQGLTGTTRHEVTRKTRRQGWKAYWKADTKEHTDRRYQLTLCIKPSRSKIKGKALAGKYKECKVYMCETVCIDILITSRNGDRKIMQPFRIASGPPMTIRKRNQFSQFR